MFKPTILLVAIASLTTGPARAEEGDVIATMDEMRYQPPKEKGTLALVEKLSLHATICVGTCHRKSPILLNPEEFEVINP